MPSKPIHIFENVGEDVTMSEWDYDKVYDVIKLRLEEIHRLGISHNDVRPANILVSETGKIWLIDFGSSRCPSNEERKRNDFAALDSIFKRNFSGNQQGNGVYLEDPDSEGIGISNNKYRSEGGRSD